jgi:hypothetical protein
LQKGGRVSVWFIQPALALAFLFFTAVGVADDPISPARIEAIKAQKIVEDLQKRLSINSVVNIAIVAHHPLVFSVERDPRNKGCYVLSMDLRFALLLKDQELYAALGHEMGHVWIFTHHPFLHTERLANDIAQRVVPREALASVYSKMWKFEGTPGVPMEQLLGPIPESAATAPLQ